MMCQQCGQAEATLKLTEIVLGEKRVRQLCEACFHGVGFVIELPKAALPAPELVQVVSQELVPVIVPASACKDCGFTFAELQKTTRLGCPEDYEHFKEGIEPLLERYHGATEHKGIVPSSRTRHRAEERARRLHAERFEALQSALANAIREERYEDAARLRDELRQCSDEDPSHGAR